MPPDRLRHSVEELCVAARQLWVDYRAGGPGSIPVEEYERVRIAADLAHRALTSETGVNSSGDDAELSQAICDLTDLARRCACTPNGLSFISGEAGLIARRDQHDYFERCLRRLDQWLATFVD